MAGLQYQDYLEQLMFLLFLEDGGRAEQATLCGPSKLLVWNLLSLDYCLFGSAGYGAWWSPFPAGAGGLDAGEQGGDDLLFPAGDRRCEGNELRMSSWAAHQS